MPPMATIRGLLIDIDGVLVVSWTPIPGAPEALGRLHEAGVPIRLVTNTTSRTRAAVVAALTAAGITVAEDEVLTAPIATAAWLRAHLPGARCLLVSSGPVEADLQGIDVVRPEALSGGDRVDAVVLGGAGPELSYEVLNRVFGLASDGVPLVAMHRNRSWQTTDGLQLDTGPLLEAIERAAGVRATVVGKPSPDFFETALAALGLPADDAAMVGDDIDADVLGAQACGIAGVLVRTGKYRPDTMQRVSGQPDHVVDSFADVPPLLGIE